MKALILAAGFGTRLEPYTRKIPKPLFTLASRPIIAHTIDALVSAGCTEILINTHHLHEQVKTFAGTCSSDIPITILHEPTILDTGGAIANAAGLLKDASFFVVNADVICDIDLKKVYKAHLESGRLATLVLHHCDPFNKVGVDKDNCILGFEGTFTSPLAFTGIQVLSPEIFACFPNKQIFSSIDLYQSLCPEKKIAALVSQNMFWSDIGTPESYALTSMRMLCAKYFELPMKAIRHVTLTPLAGDGSDRHWHRASYQKKSVILCDHGICLPGSEKDRECRAFIDIGSHLIENSLNIPEILDVDHLSGIVMVEDVGDIHLQSLIKDNPRKAPGLYRQVIDHLIDFSLKGYRGFDPEWTCQTPAYSKDLILEKECRYFIDAFVNGYLGLNRSFAEFYKEFDSIADQALLHGVIGLMHRDMQSRNIMVYCNRIYFIDFQSARLGPIQYDLASLLIDPYVDLDAVLRSDLLDYAMDRLGVENNEKSAFRLSYTACCITRNLQALGAFGFLTRVKNKKLFEQYIPCAVNSLKNIIKVYDPEQTLELSRLVLNLKGV